VCVCVCVCVCKSRRLCASMQPAFPRRTALSQWDWCTAVPSDMAASSWHKVPVLAVGSPDIARYKLSCRRLGVAACTPGTLPHVSVGRLMEVLFPLPRVRTSIWGHKCLVSNEPKQPKPFSLLVLVAEGKLIASPRSPDVALPSQK